MMRIPAATKPPMGSGRYTMASNPAPSNVPQGSPGGKSFAGIGISASGRRPGVKLTVGDEGYLWLLVAIELVLIGCFRKYFRRYHGG